MNPGTDSPAFLESNARETSTRPPFWQEVIALPLHFLLGTIGGTLLFMLLAGILGVACASIGFPVPEVGFLYNPLLWLGAVVLGPLVNRELRHRSACLVGIVGVLLLLAIMRSDISLYERSDHYRNLTHGHYWRYEFQQLFSPENRTCADRAPPCAHRAHTVQTAEDIYAPFCRIRPPGFRPPSQPQRPADGEPACGSGPIAEPTESFAGKGSEAGRRGKGREVGRFRQREKGLFERRLRHRAGANPLPF